MEKLSVVKIGGKVIDDLKDLDFFLKDFAAVQGPKILVHGGGKWVSDMSSRLGIEVKMRDGRRITDAATLDIVTMMLPGMANKKVIALLQKYGCDAMGLTGADGNLILAGKRPVIKNIDFGFVGDIKEINSERIVKLIQLGITPVFTAMTHDGRGQLLNTNADTIASSLAVAMSRYFQTGLYFCFEKKGVLTNLEDEHSVIQLINTSLYEKYKKKNLIHSGMIPKIDNAFEALKKGVTEVHICHYRDINHIDQIGLETGTVITK